MSGLYQLAMQFWRAREGAVAVYVSVVSVVMIGFGALVVDAGRVYTLQTELQNAADAAALAGAAELDRTPTSIIRARAAAKTAFVNNVQTFGSGGENVAIQDSNIRFLSSLPPDDDTPIPSTSVTTDPTKALYIEVTPTIREVDFLLGPVLSAAFGDESYLSKGEASATAVAGLECAVCKFPPLMVCNPAETNGNVGAPLMPVVGQLIRLKQGGGTGNWQPGNFGLLDPQFGNQGTADIQKSLADHDPDNCFGTFVDLRTGSSTNPVSTAINTRFDMYETPGFGGNAKNDPAYPPAPNVTKGKYKSGVSYADYTGSSPASRAMPKHPCFAAGNCDSLGPSFHPSFAPPAPAVKADQTAFWAKYWETHHPTRPFEGLYDNRSIDPNSDGIVTRKEVYEWEISSNNIPTGDTDGDTDIDADDTTTASSATGENGRPMEYTGSTAPDPQRRILYVAVINCLEHGPLNGNSEDVPVLAFAKIFLTHPAEGGSDQTLFAEVIGVLEVENDGLVLHDIVQLYR